jgi:pSer/pThr/pTyr-binding forkhead associated (FHA) protein
VLVPRPGGQRILDDRSSNGTFVNGQRVEQADLHDGDVIALGRVVLRYVDVAISGTARRRPRPSPDDELDSAVPGRP